MVVSGLSLNAFGTLDQTLCRFGDPGFVVRASARDNTSIVCTAPSSCDPLSSANEICDTGPRHISPFRRTAVRMAGESFHLSQPSVNQSSWGARKLFVSVNGQDFSGVADHGALSYLYYPLPTLTKVQPNGGPVQSPEGSVVFVHGSGFNALRDALRSSLAAGTESSTASEQCNDPARSSDHDEVVWCRFGTTTTSLSVPAVSFNDSVVECPLPKRHGAGDVVVQVSLNGLDWSGTSASHEDASMEEARNEAGGDFSRGVRRGELTGGTLLFSFFEPPIINRISPTIGHVTGGIHVTLYGARFDVYGELWQTRCRFGVDEIAAVSKSPTEIVCPLPPTSVPAAVDLRLTAKRGCIHNGLWSAFLRQSTAASHGLCKIQMHPWKCNVTMQFLIGWSRMLGRRAVDLLCACMATACLPSRCRRAPRVHCRPAQHSTPAFRR